MFCMRARAHSIATGCHGEVEPRLGGILGAGIKRSAMIRIASLARTSRAYFLGGNRAAHDASIFFCPDVMLATWPLRDSPFKWISVPPIRL